MKLLSFHILLMSLVLALCSPFQASAAADRSQEVRDVITAFVNGRTAEMGWDVRIRRITIQDALKLPDGPVDYEIIAPKQWEGWGNVNVSVLARQNDRVLRNFTVRIDVEALAETVVTLHQIENGDSISASDLVLQKREITQSSSRAARKIEEIAGKKARTTIKANQAVRADQVEKVPLIKSGQTVTIIAENEVMKISVAGKARSSGAEGDTVIVQNQNSLKEIPARVINSTTVQIAF